MSSRPSRGGRVSFTVDVGGAALWYSFQACRRCLVDSGDKAALRRDMARPGGAADAARGLWWQLWHVGDVPAPCGVWRGAVPPVLGPRMSPIKPCISTNCPCFRALSAAVVDGRGYVGGGVESCRSSFSRVGRTLVVSVVPSAPRIRPTTAPSGAI